MPETNLGEFEQIVMLVVLQLGNGGYGPEISRFLERELGRRVSRGALYSALGRLEEKGLLRWTLEVPGPDRGGHSRRRFEATERGLAALRNQRAVLQRLWTGLDGVLEAG